MNTRRCSMAMAAAAACLGTAGPAFAQFGSLQETLFRFSEFVNDNDFRSTPQGGPLFDFNIFDQRLEYNRLGDGYTFEYFQFFGPDSFGNVDTYDFGPLTIQLGLDPNLVGQQPVGIHNRAGFTRRFIPEVFFESQTGQRAFNNLSGISQFSPTPINYNISFNAGVQDFQWTGNALIDSEGRINILGFYDFELRVTNVGSFEAGGILLEDEQVTDFDIGPIDISGNIMFDVAASIIRTIFAGPNTDEIGPRIVSGAAQKGKTVDDLLRQMEAGEALTQEEVEFLIRETFVQAVLDDPLGAIVNGLPTTFDGLDGVSLGLDTASVSDTQSSGVVPVQQSLVPEPGTLALLLMGLGGAGLFRKRIHG